MKLTQQQKIDTLREALIGIVGTDDPTILNETIANCEGSDKPMEEKMIFINACYAIKDIK